MYIKDLLNKIIWDKRENPADYTIHYEDRIIKTLLQVNAGDVKLEGTVIKVRQAGEEIDIPLHRIKEVRKSGQIVWKR